MQAWLRIIWYLIGSALGCYVIYIHRADLSESISKIVGIGVLFYGFPYMIRQERRIKTVAGTSQAMKQLIDRLEGVFNDIEGTIKDVSKEAKQVIAKVDNGNRPWHENLRGKLSDYLKTAQTDLERMIYKFVDKMLQDIMK